MSHDFSPTKNLDFFRHDFSPTKNLEWNNSCVNCLKEEDYEGGGENTAVLWKWLPEKNENLIVESNTVFIWKRK